MAYYAAVVSLVQLLEEIIHRDQYRNILLSKKQILSVYEKLSHLQALLQHYSPEDEDSGERVERRIRDVAYHTQDIIESHMSDQILHELENTHSEEKISRRRVKRVFRHLISAFRKMKPLQFEELERAKEEVDSIMKEMMLIKARQRDNEENLQINSYISSRGEASKAQAQSARITMVGFDEQLTTIKGQLCGESSKLEVISIVGMGGIGKTTWARHIFDDELIDYHFDCRAWLTVSQDYHMQKVLLDIVESLKIKNELHGVREGELEERIYKCLKGMRYLIVMDDIWDAKVWDDIKKVFPDDRNGSRVILTTRLLDVAVYANNFSFIHHMQFLNEDQSWHLFCDNVFVPPELEAIGRFIAKNCRGLPLAIVVVAGLLSKVDKTEHDWAEIARNVSSGAVDQNDEHLSGILSLSYTHLPHHLKPCFLYLGGFPEDYNIRVSRVIRLWVDEGFLQPIEYKSLEDVAEEYLEDLVNRNLVLITRKSSNGKFKICRMHDLLRDLCSQRARCENFLHFLHRDDFFHQRAITNVRRLYIHPNSSFLIDHVKEYVSHVRSILFFTDVGDQISSGASNSKLLRVLVLDTRKTRFFDFPAEIVDLLHLRHLAFSGSVSRVPSSIIKLQNLQTLIVEGGTMLPSEIWKLPHLRHVMTQGATLPPIPYSEMITSGVPLLEKLQTLSGVLNFKFPTHTLEMIPNLRKLKVTYNFDPPGYWHEFCLNNFIYLHQLETLDIEFSLYSMFDMHCSPLPESFAFPLNLRKLSLKGCKLPWIDTTAVGSLPNLQVLKLRDNAFMGEEWEPIEGEFSRLKFLLLERLDLKYWRAENTHFPCLEQLLIISCDELEEIPSEMGDILTLQLIELYGSPLAANSAFKIQEEQRDMGNDVLQARLSNPWAWKF